LNFREYSHIDENTSLEQFLEVTTNSRYSVEVNFRSEKEQVLEAFAKIALGYVSASMKQRGYHVRHVFEETPLRIIVSARNWDDGSWASIVSFNPKVDNGAFYISQGFYNRGSKTVSLPSTAKKTGNSAAEIVADMANVMHELRNKKDRHQPTLKPIPLKRGPKR
jgi:hypothetical protein